MLVMGKGLVLGLAINRCNGCTHNLLIVDSLLVIDPIITAVVLDFVEGSSDSMEETKDGIVSILE